MSESLGIFVIDLDGTLLCPDGRVSKANRRAIHDARAAGWEVVLATGRALIEAQRAIRAVRHDGLFIGAGGSLISDAATGETLRRSAMDEDLVREAAGALINADHKAMLLKDAAATGYDYLVVGDAPLDPASQWWFEHLPVSVRFVQTMDEDPHPHDTVRAAAIASSSELAPLAEVLKETLGERALLQHWSAVTESAATGSTTHLLEIFSLGVNKWSAMEWWCTRQELESHQIVAIGDGLNDVEMVEGAGIGIAMGNADERVGAVAEYHTDDHANDGVAKAIHRIMTGEWNR